MSSFRLLRPPVGGLRGAAVRGLPQGAPGGGGDGGGGAEQRGGAAEGRRAELRELLKEMKVMKEVWTYHSNREIFIYTI